MSEHFFNTTHLTGEPLKEAIVKAKSQEKAILLIFQNTPTQKWSAHDITRLTERAGFKWPLWSNRRALTNLKTRGKIVKLPAQKVSPQGSKEHFWQIAPTTPTI